MQDVVEEKSVFEGSSPVKSLTTAVRPLGYLGHGSTMDRRRLAMHRYYYQPTFTPIHNLTAQVVLLAQEMSNLDFKVSLKTVYI